MIHINNLMIVVTHPGARARQRAQQELNGSKFNFVDSNDIELFTSSLTCIKVGLTAIE